MAFPYRLYGGATRPDAITGLNPAFSQALTALYNAAPPDVQAQLGLTSGYRSIERQRQLWEASDKSGHMVAAPGRSRHNFGTAADLYGFGTGGGAVSQAARDWVHQNAGAYGLAFPMTYEPWHIQMRGGVGGPPQATVTAQGGEAPQAAMPQPPQPGNFADNVYAQAIFGQPQDWMQNKSYSFDALASDFLAHRNPLRRFVYQKLFGA